MTFIEGDGILHGAWFGTAYISLGSNLGNRMENLHRAIAFMDSPSVRVTAVSRFYETVPVGATLEPVPMYINCVVCVETTLSPENLLDFTQDLERTCGRMPTFRWGPRVIDADILLFDDLEIHSERLTIPHPRMMERAFALLPLAEIDPDIVFPNGVSLRERLANPEIQSQTLTLLEAEATI